MQISAAVVQEVGAPFTLTEVELQEPAPDEVVVQIAGAGICHTDIAVQHGHLPFPLPGVLGHEGSGTVVSVGADVTTVAVGDQVAISFNSCAACPQCAKGQPAYCHGFLEYNFSGGARRWILRTSLCRNEIGGELLRPVVVGDARAGS